MASPKHESKQSKQEKPDKSLSVAGRLSTLNNEAVQQRETAQKIALQALREATTTETVVRHLKYRTFANLSKSAKADCPGACFDKFLKFHSQIAETTREIASIEATIIENKSEILHETTLKRRTTTIALKSRSSDENKNPAAADPPSGFGNLARLAKEIEKEAANWFMEFIEKALEKGMNKCKSKSDAEVPQSLILQVLHWVEAKQSSVHAKPSHITRKLRIKLKNYT